MLKAGFYEKEITPPLGYDMPGYFSHRYANGVMDRLYAKAAAFNLGEKTVITIVLDGLETADMLCNPIYERIEKLIGVKKENIMISATHTHRGFPCEDKDNNAKDYKAYFHILKCLIADTAVLAYQRMVPVTAGYGNSIEKGLTFNRNFYMKDGSIRTNPGIGNPDIVKVFGKVDEEFSTIFFLNEEKNPIGMLSNFACHHDSVGSRWSALSYSSDYSGILAKSMKEKFGGDFVSVFFSGACGNLNHIDVKRTEPYDHPRYLDIGKALFDAAMAQFEEIEEMEVSVLDSVKEMISVKVLKPTLEEAEEAKYLIENIGENEYIADIAKPDSLGYKRANAKSVLDKYNMPDYLDVPVQTIRLGDLVIFALIAEQYTEHGLMLKERTNAKLTMVATMANGVFGEYVAAKEAFGTEIYEVQPAASMFVPESGEQMVNAAISQMERLF